MGGWVAGWLGGWMGGIGIKAKFRPAGAGAWPELGNIYIVCILYMFVNILHILE